MLPLVHILLLPLMSWAEKSFLPAVAAASVACNRLPFFWPAQAMWAHVESGRAVPPLLVHTSLQRRSTGRAGDAGYEAAWEARLRGVQRWEMGGLRTYTSEDPLRGFLREARPPSAHRLLAAAGKLQLAAACRHTLPSAAAKMITLLTTYQPCTPAGL